MYNKLGYQEKIYNPDSDSWVKYDHLGGEAVAEVLISEFLLSCSNTTDFVRYKLLDDNLTACVSQNFAKGYVYVPFERIIGLSDIDFSNMTTKEKFNTIVDITTKITSTFAGEEKSTGVSLKQMVYLDAMFRNPDRHLSNFGLLVGQSDVRLAPIFDNGCALGVKTGLYWDIDNVIAGYDCEIEPYNESVVNVLNFFSPNPFDFDVHKFMTIHDKRITASNKFFGAFLNIICKFYPTDKLGADVRTLLEERYGDFRPRRYQVRWRNK